MRKLFMIGAAGLALVAPLSLCQAVVFHSAGSTPAFIFAALGFWS